MDFPTLQSVLNDFEVEKLYQRKLPILSAGRVYFLCDLDEGEIVGEVILNIYFVLN